MMSTQTTHPTIDLPSFQSCEEDLKEHFVNEFTTGGFSFPRDADAWELAALFVAMKQRSISPRSRLVHWSPELKLKLTSPEWARFVHALTTIEAESIAGMDLKPRMSQDVEDVELHDDLFNEWRIQHLHLADRRPNPNEFVERAAELLFVMVEEDDIYFIDLLKHEFSDPALLELVHRNWPQLIDDSRSDHICIPHEMRPSPAEHGRRRRAGFTKPVAMSDGTVYLCPGGGIVLSERKRKKHGRGKGGHLNLEAIRNANDIHRIAYSIHKWCNENAPTLVSDIQRQTGEALTSLRTLRLRLDNDGPFFEELITGFQVRP
ncbi:MAG TPA: hypothetical protein PK156_35760 [Polyangium sp.]|nr:hypothetical protein [Polyangium sp.]